MARRKSYEITDEQYANAIEWLENGGTKRGACDILGVSNNKTMESLIDEHLERKVRDRELRAKKRKTAVDKAELVGIITDYLAGASLSELSSIYYRSTNVLQHHLEKNGALLRVNETIDVLNPPALPEQCVVSEHSVGDFVWSSKYGCIAQVKALFQDAYRIRVWGEGVCEYSYQPAEELGSLQHLLALGVNLQRIIPTVMDNDEITLSINEALRAANKRK